MCIHLSLLCIALLLAPHIAHTLLDNDGTSQLHTITLSHLPELLLQKCTLLGVPPYPSLQDVESLLLELAHVFQNEPHIFIGQFPLHATKPNVTDSILWRPPIKDAVVNIALYERESKDRTCLLFPSKTKFYAHAYTGQLNVEVLVQYVNEKCHTFRTARGRLSPEGLHHAHIMNNLFTPEHTVQDCPELNRIPSKTEFFTDYLFRSRPVIIKNAYKDSIPIKKWSQEYLRRLYGHKRIHIKLTDDGAFEGAESATLWRDHHDNRIPPNVKSQLEFPDLVVVRPATREMLFSDFLDLIAAGNITYSAYLEYSSIPDHMRELEKDVHELPFVGGGLLERRHLNMWLSDGNTLGKLHFDPFDNFLCMVSMHACTQI